MEYEMPNQIKIVIIYTTLQQWKYRTDSPFITYECPRSHLIHLVSRRLYE